jgi:hypothetical protein
MFVIQFESSFDTQHYLRLVLTHYDFLYFRFDKSYYSRIMQFKKVSQVLNLFHFTSKKRET